MLGGMETFSPVKHTRWKASLWTVKVLVLPASTVLHGDPFGVVVKSLETEFGRCRGRGFVVAVGPCGLLGPEAVTEPCTPDERVDAGPPVESVDAGWPFRLPPTEQPVRTAIVAATAVARVAERYQCR